MKIFIIPSWYPYPTNPVNGTFFQDHAEKLAEAGHEVTVIACEIISLKNIISSHKDLGNHVYKKKNVKTYQQILLNRHPRNQKGFYKRYQKLLQQLIEKVLKEEGRPDLFHVHSSLWAGAALSSFDLGIPIIISEHIKEFLLNEGFSDFQKQLIQDTYAKVQGLITPSTAVLDQIKENFQIPGSCPTHVVPNMVDTDYFTPLKHKPHNDRFTFLIVANLRPEKRIDTIIKAFIPIANTHLAKISIVGDGPEYKKIHETAQHLSLMRQMEFIRKSGKEVVKANMQKADVCMLFSQMETFGITLIEALSCGIPVIGGNIGGASDIIHEKNGIIVPTHDNHALQEAMRYMIKHPEKYNAQEIRQDAIDRFDKKVIIAKLEAIYKILIYSK
jgi:glycosyltransferase involved in cell wall biosynthesis